jgi:hypothetical protein
VVRRAGAGWAVVRRAVVIAPQPLGCMHLDDQHRRIVILGHVWRRRADTGCQRRERRGGGRNDRRRRR